MTTNEVARLFGKDKPAEPGSSSGAAEALRQVQESALGLLTGLDRAPTSLRIKTDRVEIEVAWPEPVAAAVAAPEIADSTGGGDDSTVQYVTAHTVGVFYRASEPGGTPFAGPGDVIAPGQQLGIIEAMKLMIPIESEVAGRIVEVLVADGAQVEYGETLFALEPVD